jgi:alkylation response protein AidB-like acyl-CoA dehydrogenase
VLRTDSRTGFDAEHELFRDSVRKFFARELVPNLSRWEADGNVDRSFWRSAGAAGLLCPTAPEALGGLGLNFRYNAIIGEELAYAGSAAGIRLQSDIVVDYLVNYGSAQQKQQWVPQMISGEVIAAIAMTEPGAGSDLQNIRTAAIRDGDEYVISGVKTYITNGRNADLVIVAVKTDAAARGKGISLMLVEAERSGFSRGMKLDKIGQRSADTCELFFDDVRIPVANRLGDEGGGFACLMLQLPRERLSIAIGAQAAAQRAFDEALTYTQQRPAFGKTVFDFQNTRFELADMAANLQIGWAHVDWALERHIAGKLTAPEACSAKLWHGEMLWEICDRSLQLHGGAGYMNESPIARLWRDSRVYRIYGGTSEIMKEIIGRSLR